MSYWSRSFPGLAENLAEVRQFIQMVLGDAPGAELVVLAVSELAGNAIVHTASGAPGGQFVVHLAAFADRWQVRVDDAGSATEPHVVVDGMDAEDDWDAESGRGLAMVASISRKWGVLGDRDARAVWAEIPYPVQPGGGIASAMSGGMMDALESVARALVAEDAPRYQELEIPVQRRARPCHRPGGPLARAGAQRSGAGRTDPRTGQPRRVPARAGRERVRRDARTAAAAVLAAVPESACSARDFGRGRPR